ncbi:hypothetical protein [Laspinema palackyanum]|uniref:hypothetical protein n=1 Tax=Laspinema palackyanum TaxID=3231601 RepID=UPI00345D564C|nr:hypothetical protein [Laspinema sp. D2c]
MFVVTTSVVSSPVRSNDFSRFFPNFQRWVLIQPQRSQTTSGPLPLARGGLGWGPIFEP